MQVKKKKILLSCLILATKNEHFGAGLRMLALGMLTAASSRIRFQESLDQFPPYPIRICIAPGIQFILGLYECRVGPIPRPYKVVHRCGLDKEMAVTKKSLVQQIFFVACDTYGRHPAETPRSLVQCANKIYCSIQTQNTGG